MTDVLRRKRYNETRILVETLRLLEPQFGNTIVCVTGAQLELLRNLMTYANRESTFVSAYEAGYYLSPTASEWDSLRSIISDLEDKLMAEELGIYGWDGAGWRKLPLLWGFSGIVEGNYSDTDLDAGANDVDGPAVDTGEIWVITCVSGRYSGTVPTFIRADAVGLAGAMQLFRQDAPASGRWYPVQVHVTLQEEDFMRLHVEGATATDDLLLRYSGYKMKIAE